MFFFCFFCVAIQTASSCAICYTFKDVTETFIYFHCRYTRDDRCDLNRSVCCCSGDFAGCVDYNLLQTTATKKGLRTAVEYVAHLWSRINVWILVIIIVITLVIRTITTTTTIVIVVVVVIIITTVIN